MSKTFVYISFILFFVSCSSIEKSHMNGPINLTIESHMIANIEVDTSRRLEGYASGGYLFHLFKVSGDNKYADGIVYNGDGSGFFSFLSKVDAVKSAAAFNAIRTSKAEVLVSPQYVIEESSWNPFYKSVKVKVTGYPGRILSIKTKD